MISEYSATLRGILIAFVAAELTQIISLHSTTKRYNSEESINLSNLLIATFHGSYNSKRPRNFLTCISQECLILTITPRYYTLICSSIPGKLSRIEVFTVNSIVILAFLKGQQNSTRRLFQLPIDEYCIPSVLP